MRPLHEYTPIRVTGARHEVPAGVLAGQYANRKALDTAAARLGLSVAVLVDAKTAGAVLEVSDLVLARLDEIGAEWRVNISDGKRIRETARQQALEALRAGLSVAEVARCLDTSRAQVLRWQKAHEHHKQQVRHAKKAGTLR